MKLSAETFYLQNFMSEAEAVRLLAGAGFDCVDFSMDQLVDPDHVLNGANWKQFARELRHLGDDLGITFNQAHAPFEFQFSQPGFMEKDAIPLTIRSFEAANILGVDTVIVHPLHFMRYRSENLDAIWDMNMDFFHALLPHARACNVCICLENLFQFDSRGVAIPDTCSEPDRYVRALDELNDPHIAACVDVGHAALIGDKPSVLIRALGHDRLKALHIHDNDAVTDTHTLPYLGGRIDWDDTCRALGEIDYDGVFTFESFLFYKNFPPEFFPQAARFIHEMGLHLAAKVDAARPKRG
ncbi:MAG: sugar phosphate isomerase/epimerase [Clostridiales bacterium]|jgi:L-ribulose-5-phosphate 3-epimerase|nr:sugar phosphate isomerase/epimerase family protein [Bacillota bacterium]NLL54477.1 sugar phosphate isomerase/epimerase [Clostridiales bacterium]